MNEDSYHIYVDANKQPFSMNLKEIWAYRDLIWLFTKRTFKLIYKQTVLGPLWIILTPLFTSIVYTVIFGKIAELSTDGIPQFLFYLTGNALWSFFGGSLSQTSVAFISNAHVYSKVYFPRLTIPISNVISSAIQLLIQMVMIGGLIVFYAAKGMVHPNLAYLPILIPVLLFTALLSFGIGTMVSSLTTKYRDLNFLVGFGLRLWMYASPVIYPMTQIGNGVLRSVILWNPMTAPMELFRFVLLGTGTVRWQSVLSTVIFASVAIVLGILLFRKAEKTFVDTI